MVLRVARSDQDEEKELARSGDSGAENSVEDMEKSIVRYTRPHGIGRSGRERRGTLPDRRQRVTEWLCNWDQDGEDKYGHRRLRNDRRRTARRNPGIPERRVSNRQFHRSTDVRYAHIPVKPASRTLEMSAELMSVPRPEEPGNQNGRESKVRSKQEAETPPIDEAAAARTRARLEKVPRLWKETKKPPLLVRWSNWWYRFWTRLNGQGGDISH